MRVWRHIGWCHIRWTNHALGLRPELLPLLKRNSGEVLGLESSSQSIGQVGPIEGQEHIAPRVLVADLRVVEDELRLHIDIKSGGDFFRPPSNQVARRHPKLPAG